jgi:hypothetical protein
MVFRKDRKLLHKNHRRHEKSTASLSDFDFLATLDDVSPSALDDISTFAVDDSCSGAVFELPRTRGDSLPAEASTTAKAALF